jgi:hypothetical protein
LLYLQNTGDPSDSGPLSRSYSTTFSPPTDPSGATITYGAGSFVGPTAFLLVKDGNQTPAWYLFNLTSLVGWDGKETLELSNFWPQQGSISHVALYGTPVPIPTAAWLLGTGLIGLVAIRRRTRK